MSDDILNHQPALPSTVLPGTWLIDLPHDPVIHVRRYRILEEGQSAGEDKDDRLQRAWRSINSSGDNEPRSVLAQPCAVICGKDDGNGIENAQSRELWVFQASKAGENPDEPPLEPDLSALHRITPDLPPTIPSQTLSCPRHGHDLSCLRRPSTSQRPLKSCDVRFDPQGTDKLVWLKLAQAITEKWQWRRGKRMYARREMKLQIRLYPTATGLMLRIRTRSRPRRPTSAPSVDSASLVELQPLALPAILIGPYCCSEAVEATLNASFGTSLGPGWKDQQCAAMIQTRLEHREFYPYTVLWVPSSDQGSRGDGDMPDASLTDGKGILTIWPTHLISGATPHKRRFLGPQRPTPVSTPESHLDLMTAASSLFDAMVAYREPVPEITPPSDHSPQAPLVEDEGSATATATPQPDDMHAQTVDENDDLEDLFASNTPARSPEAFDMFGAQDDRRLSGGNNAHLIDYGDVVMSSPPAQEERRESFRRVIGSEDAVDEPDPAFVTEDDFNFFDSPNDDLVAENEAPSAAEVAEPQTDLTGTDEPEQPTTEQEWTVPLAQEDGVVEDVSVGQDLDPSEHVTNEAEASDVQPPPKTSSPAVPPLEARAPDLGNALPFDVRAAVSSRPKHELVPSAFGPLDLTSSGTTFHYSLPSPAPTPQNLNVDLIERLSSPKATKKAYDYAAAWLFDTPTSEVDEEEYTGPPTPVSYLDDNDESTAGPTPLVPSKSGPSELEYEGLPCVATEWFVMVDDIDRLRQLSYVWSPSWTGGSGQTSKPRNTIEPSIEPSSKKRKRATGNEHNIEDIDWDALAIQLVVDEDFRRSLAHAPQQATKPMASPDAVESIGVTLSDFVEPDADVEEGEPLEHKLAGPSGFSQCSIHTGFKGNVIRVSIAALRYWRELDLQPLSGGKDVKAVVVFDSACSATSTRQNFERLSSAYKSMSLGECQLDSSFGDAGLLSHADKGTYTKALAWVGKQDENAVIIVVSDPSHPGRLDSYFARTALSALKPTQMVQLVPTSSFTHRDISHLARSLYDRFPRQLRVTHSAEETAAPWYDYPAFTLCPETPPKPHLTLQWPIKSFDIFGSYRWIHAAYGASSDGRSVAVVVSDSEGENWRVKVLRGLLSKGWSEVVSAIWQFLMDFATASAIEWRLSVCRMGPMGKLELDAWRQLYVTNTNPISLMMSELASSLDAALPRNGPPNVQPGIINDPITTISDESLAGSHFVWPQRQPVVIESTVIYPESTFLVSLSSPNLEHDTTTVHLLFHRPAPAQEDEDAEAVLAKELYRIGCWSRVKFGLKGLPGHLGAVHAILDGMSAIEE